jgi:tRNA nucleotidyltransferase/poly(A) polymerase
MILTFEDLFPSPLILQALRQHKLTNQKIFLVGGAVRDRLLGKTGHDLDLSVSGDVRLLARKIAAELSAAFYMMDEQHQTARVIYTLGTGERCILDFAAMRGLQVEQDLSMRDFTVNAMAIDLDDPEKLIDPLKGVFDIRQKVIRACYPQALSDDPIRVLRAVRHSLDWNFRIIPETVILLKKAASQLESTTIERRRDELFRIFDGTQVHSAIEILDRIGGLNALLPELINLKGLPQSYPHIYDGWQHSLRLVTELQNLYDLLVTEYNEEKSANLLYGMANLQLGRFREGLKRHFARRLNPDRSLRSLLLLTGLYHDIGKPLTASQAIEGKIRFIGHEDIGSTIGKSRARALALASTEVEYVELIIQNHMHIHHLSAANSQVSRRSIYRYYRKLNSVGVDLCLLSLADTLATYGVTIASSKWERELGICRQILTAWFEQPEEIISPPRLITGDDLIAEYHLKPGPKIGFLLEQVKEAQVTGEITNRAEAIAYTKKLLNSGMVDDERSEDGT